MMRNANHPSRKNISTTNSRGGVGGKNSAQYRQLGGVSAGQGHSRRGLLANDP